MKSVCIFYAKNRFRNWISCRLFIIGLPPSFMISSIHELRLFPPEIENESSGKEKFKSVLTTYLHFMHYLPTLCTTYLLDALPAYLMHYLPNWCATYLLDALPTYFMWYLPTWYTTYLIDALNLTKIIVCYHTVNTGCQCLHNIWKGGETFKSSPWATAANPENTKTVY